MKNKKQILEYKLKKGFEAIKNNNSTISHGARISGLSYRESFEKLIENKILSESEANEKIERFEKDMLKVIED